MPLDIWGQGWSEETERKQDHFRYFLQVHLRVVMAIWAKYAWAKAPYLFLDWTAGAGQIARPNASVLPGSPLIFMEEAREAGAEFSALFVERAAPAAENLRLSLQAQCPELLGFAGACRVLCADHTECVDEMAAFVRDSRGAGFGLAYVDPNGTWLPVEALRRLMASRSCHRLDLLAYVSAANYKRFRRAFAGSPSLLADLQRVGKKHIYVRQPYKQHQWAFVFLTNYGSYPEVKKIGFHSSESQEGRAILDRLDRTTEERGGQGGLDL